MSTPCHTSQLDANPFFPSASPKKFGSNARTEETNSDSPLSKLFSQDASGPTLVLVSTLDPMIPTTPSLHSWTRSLRLTTDTSQLTSTSQTWITLILTAHHSQLMRTR